MGKAARGAAKAGRVNTLTESRDDPKKGRSWRLELVVNFDGGGFVELHCYTILPVIGSVSFGGLCEVVFKSLPHDIVHNHYVDRGETPPLDRAEALKAISIMTSKEKEHDWDVWHIIKDSEATA